MQNPVQCGMHMLTLIVTSIAIIGGSYMSTAKSRKIKKGNGRNGK